jgi:hypothetical protein
VSDVKCHPNRPLVAFSSYDQGSLQLWDYDMKLLMNLREFISRDNNKLNNTKSSFKGNTHYDSRYLSIIIYDDLCEVLVPSQN